MGRAQRELERAQRHPGLRDHLTVGEEIRLAARQHWIVLVRPLLAAVGVTALSLLIFVKAPARIGSTLPWVLVGVMSVMWLRFVWRIIVRRHDMFVATDKRILKYQGIVQTDVPMMRISKVTDMRFTRSVAGEILGYGTIVIESAGQDQAIRDVTYLPDPVENYRRLCEVIFGDKHHPSRGKKPKGWRRQLDRLTSGRRGGPGSDPHELDSDESLQRPDLDPPPRGEGAGRDSTQSRAIPLHAPTTHSAATPIHRPTWEPEVLFESEDIKARRRAADTGPVPYVRPPDHD